MVTFLTIHSNAELTPDFYNDVCPQALSIINTIVRQKLDFKPRMGAHLLRLHFHDCFVNVSYFYTQQHLHIYTKMHLQYYNLECIRK